MFSAVIKKLRVGMVGPLVLKSLRSAILTRNARSSQFSVEPIPQQLDSGEQHPEVNQLVEKRRRNVYYLIEGFKRFEKFFITLKEDAAEKLGPHAFSIIVREGLKFTKDEFVAYIEGEGVDSRNLFYSIPTQCLSYAFLGYKLGDFPEAEFCSNNGTHIGCHQDLELPQLDHVIKTVEQFLKSKGFKA